MGFQLRENATGAAAERSAARPPRVAAQTRIGAPCCNTILSTKYWDSDTKTLAYQLRDYGPGIGRWLSRDPVGEFGSLNLSCYIQNGMVSFYDYLGLAYTQLPSVIKKWNTMNFLRYMNMIGVDKKGETNPYSPRTHLSTDWELVGEPKEEVKEETDCACLFMVRYICTREETREFVGYGVSYINERVGSLNNRDAAFMDAVNARQTFHEAKHHEINRSMINAIGKETYSSTVANCNSIVACTVAKENVDADFNISKVLHDTDIRTANQAWEDEDYPIVRQFYVDMSKMYKSGKEL